MKLSEAKKNLMKVVKWNGREWFLISVEKGMVRIGARCEELWVYPANLELVRHNTQANGVKKN